MKHYIPPCSITPEMLSLVASIAEAVGRMQASGMGLRLRRINRVRTIQGSLAIEGNTLNEQQITAIIEGKRVAAPPREIREVQNALAVYEQLPEWNPLRERDLLAAHALLMKGLLDSAGSYRQRGVGVMGRKEIVHMAPPANRVPELIASLFHWLQQTDFHPLVASSIFHYEFEFIHPFEDGNGRMGRFWQSLLLYHWSPVFEHLPIESMIFAHQQDYYDALNQSTQAGDSAHFLSFMLRTIKATLEAPPQDNPQHTPQVEVLLAALQGEMSRSELMATLGLSDRKSFRERYLQPALQAGLIEMTIPDKPNSRWQKYRLAQRKGM